MKRKRETLFAIVTAASATIGIAGSGCNGSIYAGSAIDEDSGAAARMDSGTRDSGPKVDDASPINVGCDASGCDGACGPYPAPTSIDLDESGGWNPPAAPSAAACSDQDLTTFRASFMSNTLTGYNDLESGLSASCVSCLFTDESAPNWSLVVLNHQDEKEGFINFGACYATELNNACGKAKQYFEFCMDRSCAPCSDADYAACEALPSVREQCNTNFAYAISVDCGDDAGDAAAPDDATCSDPIEGAAVLCGGNAADGG